MASAHLNLSFLGRGWVAKLLIARGLFLQGLELGLLSPILGLFSSIYFPVLLRGIFYITLDECRNDHRFSTLPPPG